MKVGPRPNQLACTPDGKLAYVPCDDASWWVIDTVNAQGAQEDRHRRPAAQHALFARRQADVPRARRARTTC